MYEHIKELYRRLDLHFERLQRIETALIKLMPIEQRKEFFDDAFGINSSKKEEE